MQRFTEKIVGLMKSEQLFESQGGPIILSQVNFLRLLFLYINLYFKPTNFHLVFESLY